MINKRNTSCGEVIVEGADTAAAAVGKLSISESKEETTAAPTTAEPAAT